MGGSFLYNGDLLPVMGAIPVPWMSCSCIMAGLFLSNGCLVPVMSVLSLSDRCFVPGPWMAYSCPMDVLFLSQSWHIPVQRMSCFCHGRLNTVRRMSCSCVDVNGFEPTCACISPIYINKYVYTTRLYLDNHEVTDSSMTHEA